MSRRLFFKIFVFLTGLVIVISRLTMIFTIKEQPVGPNVNYLITPNELCEKQDGFYGLEKNSLDVVFIGSSNIHCNINPNVIWNSFGITSYDFSCDQQELGTSYYYLQQVFETQKPKVVVVDIMGNGEQDEIDNTRAHFAFDHMKNDIYKYKAIWNRTKSARLEMMFPLIAYHDRWKELTQNDYQYIPNQYNILKGAFIYMTANECERPQIPTEIPVSELPEKTKYWIEAIQELCNEHECKCLFIKAPYSFYEDSWFSYFNAFEDYCVDKGFSFINLNKYVDDMGISFATDFSDGMHMNWEGQQKLSIYIGDYLVKHYSLEDKRGVTDYSKWDDDYLEMTNLIDDFWDIYNNM
ncbi:hypothetical protein [Butyrivibrio sp. M55]|uniref:hypothetical protein n=1 Tax=Butyrivibrio sp. M55 TaxID=1855323 RepID=UPI0008EA2783|nr:hypothetical protein [Butyrivibrio sp. M55]SFU85087.1 hypothetical protein SAMN05216540_11418 [Butyrivibrio sp. M55]